MADAVQQPPKKRMVKRKPARKQVDQMLEKKPLEQTGQTYNTWYHKWAGGDKYDAYANAEKSATRVNVKLDSGYTRGDGAKNPYICMYFARGCCPYGVECSYLHRLPSPSMSLPDAAMDVFGREKHSTYRDDMGGVGSFNRQNRTLYIGKIKETRNTAEDVEEHFSEFGEIERIKILTNRGVAFVTYVSELNAQFAKEAMMFQSLENDEVLNVRWATIDPNPAAAAAEQKRLLALGEQGIAKALDPEFVQRVRELDELDGVVAPREPSPPPPEEEEEGGREKKRQRIEPPPAGTVAEELAHNARAVPPPAAAPPAPASAPAAAGILSANAVDSLRYLAELREKRAAEGGAAGAPAAPAAAAAAVAKPKTVGLGALAAYGSDDESD
ncbi:hypothetical protein JCM8097_004720 [Rhodosporidiobolus ruineniae]